MAVAREGLVLPGRWRCCCCCRRLLLGFWLLALARAQIRYSVFEELERGSIVGNIAKDLGLDLVQLNSRGLKITRGGEQKPPPFQVNLSNGLLYITERIDREEVCGGGQTPAAACKIHCELLIESPLEMHRLEVEVMDVNDNAPQFHEKEDVLSIPESALMGARFPLPKALDLDIGMNALHGYVLSTNPNFDLKMTTGSDRIKSAELTLTRALDRETQSIYELVLTAFDGGVPKRSGTTRITIKVIDANDNAPTFDQSVYRIKLSENAPVGTTVMRLNATDMDEGLNGEVRYYFNKRVPGNVQRVFHIEETSGLITLQAALDYEDTRQYDILADALDRGPLPMAGLCEVIVELVDINDNPPVISINSVSGSVAENAKSGTVVALFTVSDRDSGDNGRVVCSVPSALPFTLQNPYNNHYSLILNGHLDRETVKEYIITITAVDKGSPPLSTSTILNMLVSDVNDNAPVFTQPSYTMYVLENNVPGTHVFTVSATDFDLKKNGYLTYSLISNITLDSLVSINSENGKIYAMKSFDYEELQRFQFQVQAKDAGVPPLSSRVSVEVFILDQNDNAPTILPSNPQKEDSGSVNIPRAVDTGYLVTKIRAVDADSGYHAWLSYHILQSKDTPPFQVGLHTGEVRASRTIREQEASTYSLVVLVNDRGDPALSSTVTLSITTMDKSSDVPQEFIKHPESDHSISDMNLYLVISIAFVSFVFLVTLLIFVALRIHKARADTATYGQTYCSNKSWLYTQNKNYSVSLGDPSNSILVLNNTCPRQSEEIMRSTETLEGRTQPNVEDLLMLGEDQLHAANRPRKTELKQKQ